MEDIINSIDILGHLCMIWGNISVVCNRCSAQDNTEPCVCVTVYSVVDASFARLYFSR